MQSLIRFTLEQKIFFNLAFILLVIAGFFAMSAMPTERFPDINMAIVNITTDYPGASATDVETLVTRKLEEALENIENIEWLSSSSHPERSYIRIKLIDDSDYQKLYNEIRFEVLNAKSDLPSEIDPPKIENITMGDLLPVLIVNLVGQHDNRALSLMAEQIRAPLQRIQGVKKVVVSGEFTREFHIYLDPEKLRTLGVSFDEITHSLEDANLSVAAGSFLAHGNDYQIKVDEKLYDRDQVVNTIIRRDGEGSFIRLRDLITRADFDYRKPYIISSVNGKNAVSLNVIKTPEGNALAIKENVLKVLDQFKPLIDREQLEISLTQDSSIKINDGLSTLGWNLAVGMLLVSVITWYFVGIRNAGLITIGIPFSFLITILVMYMTNYSFNEITLFAFVLVSGIIVDDAIVVTDNIYRHIQEGRQPYQAIIEGTAEVAIPVISSTITTIAAFLPMLIMTGTTGEFFAQIPAAVSFALLASLFECLFILPSHYLDFGPQKAKELTQRLEEDNFIMGFFRDLTQKVLNWTLKFRALTVFIVTLLFLASIATMYVSMTGILPLIKTQFFPDDYAIYFVDIKGPPNTSMNKIDEITREVSRTIMEDGPEKAKSATGMAGVFMNEDYELIFGNNYGVVLVTLPAKQDQDISDPMVHLDQIRTKLKKQFEKNDVALFVHPMREGPPSGKAINIKVMGSNLNAVSGLAENLRQFLKTNVEIAPYLVELEDDRGSPKKVYRFDIRHERVKEYSLSSSEVTRMAGSVLDGRYIGKFRANDEEIDLKLLIDQKTIEHPQQVLSIPFLENAISPILLSDVTELRSYEEPSELNRYRGQRAISIKADLKTGSPVSSSSVISTVARYYDTIRNDYPGATLLFSGEYENTQRSYESLIFAFFIAVMIIYMVLAAQFQSYLQPAIILSSIIFAFIGIVLGKFLTQSIFTVNSFIAVIGVVGVVVNDALVLIDFINKNYRSGLSRRESIDNAIKVRIRPIILTTVTTVLGLLPMALGIPNYSVVWGTMASTFVTGLGTATLLTLFVVPVLWDLIQARQERIQQ
ncbi:efflux RND transporter permease subunit [Methylicorpusculum oleiharenae]|uniref:efflux RND transporter permease subunit n=1 Tax=Methylicorpusculum oleiharenae TaxID=1338687 RepID=UPI0013578A91|nr:efflux RND transporter permease subunit [Methylicorpusculum oleiharenae]MCD2451331.1 efflux RND transporter permease subunit [Methylicorpusculum oleiharenae]